MDYLKIKQYLEGEISESESQDIRNWLSDPENDLLSRKLLGEVWAGSEINYKGEKPDVNRMLSVLHYRIQSKSDQLSNKSAQTIGARIIQGWMKVAAILVIPLLLLASYFIVERIADSRLIGEVNFREIVTKPGTRTQIELPDGTLVWLNDGTTIRYPEQFTEKERVVFLDGEAYFEVKSNPKEPFIVENPMMKTRVTGTHFNLNAYSSDRFFEATLLEGKIQLVAGKQHIDLLPGEQLQYNVSQNILQKKEVRSDDAAAWIHGKLIIHNEKLEIAMKKLSRWYNVDIQLEDALLKNYDLTYTLHNEKLEQSLNYISQVLPVKYSYSEIKYDDRTEQRIVMTRK